jgi:hypothetical protein
MFNNLTYDLLITGEAIMYNNPVYLNSNLDKVFESYPSSYEKLDTGKLYAWQITCRNGSSFAAQTEVWTFRLKPVTISNVASVNPMYINLKRKDEGGGMNFIEGDDLFVKYYSYDKTRDTKLKIISAAGDLLQEQEQNILYGNNFMRIKLNRSVEKNKIYNIELSDLQGTVYSTSFIIQ